MRVAAVLDTWFVSGPGRQLAALSSKLKQEGIELRIFMFQRRGRPPAPFIEYLDGLGVACTVIPECGAADLGLPARLARALIEWQPDIVQTHGYRPTTLIALLNLKKKRWPWIGYFHGDTFENLKVRIYHQINRTLLPLADRIVVLSEEHRRLFKKDDDKVRLIHNASLVLPAPPRSSQLPTFSFDAKPVIGALSRLSPEKGLDLLLAAVAQLRDSGIILNVAVGGDGPEEENLRKQAAGIGLGDRVRFFGRIDDVRSFYKSIDVLVLASRPGSEGLPNVLLEAIREDVPVVATAVAAVPEVLSQPGSGVLVQPGSVDALAGGIKEALATGRNPEATYARERVTDQFSMERRVLAHLEIYDEILSSCRSGSGRPKGNDEQRRGRRLPRTTLD